MATVVRKGSGAANVVFGVSGITVTGTIVQGYDNDYSSDTAETPDTVGDTVALAFFNAKNEVSVDCLFNSASALTHVPGDALTINSIAGHIKRFKHMGESQGFQKVRFEIVRYAANALT
jgi:hypothetical protein